MLHNRHDEQCHATHIFLVKKPLIMVPFSLPFHSPLWYANRFIFKDCIIQKGSQKLCSFGFALIHLALSCGIFWDALAGITWWGIERWKVLALLNALESWPDFFYLKWADQRTADGLLTACERFSAPLAVHQVTHVVHLHLHTNRPGFFTYKMWAWRLSYKYTLSILKAVSGLEYFNVAFRI